MLRLEQMQLLKLKLLPLPMHFGEPLMRSVLVIMSMFLLTGCVTLTGTTATNGSACSVWKDVSWSKKDTDQTITEIKVNNARRDGFCKGEK